MPRRIGDRRPVLALRPAKSIALIAFISCTEVMAVPAISCLTLDPILDQQTLNTAELSRVVGDQSAFDR